MPKTILIVDDDLLRTTLSVLLTGQFGDVSFVEAANGADAIEKTKVNSPDLIILDLAMPVMNGLIVMTSAIGRSSHATSSSHHSVFYLPTWAA